ESFEVAESDADPAARLERLVRAALEIVDRNQAFWRLSYQIRMQPEVLATLGEDVVGWTEATRAHLEALLREAGAGRPEVESRVLFAAIDGAAQHYVLDPENYPVDEVCREIVARFTPAGGMNQGRRTCASTPGWTGSCTRSGRTISIRPTGACTTWTREPARLCCWCTARRRGRSCTGT